MEIGFDPRKAAANQRKHRVSFDEAASCLLDPQALVMEDARAEGESRWPASWHEQPGSIIDRRLHLARGQSAPYFSPKGHYQGG